MHIFVISLEKFRSELWLLGVPPRYAAMANEGPQLIEIQLVKGPKGLGFNIRGGTDNEHRVDDPRIYVTTVKADGAAAEDGRLQPGDKIIEINGVDVTAVKHYEAVKLFHTAKDAVNLKVIRESDDDTGFCTASEEEPEERSRIGPIVTTVLLIGLGVGAYFAWRRYSKGL